MDRAKRVELREKIASTKVNHDQAMLDIGLMSGGPVLTEFEEKVVFDVAPKLLNYIDGLEVALYDAIRRPMGVIPRSAESFVTSDGLEAAGIRRYTFE